MTSSFYAAAVGEQQLIGWTGPGIAREVFTLSMSDYPGQGAIPVACLLLFYPSNSRCHHRNGDVNSLLIKEKLPGRADPFAIHSKIQDQTTDPFWGCSGRNQGRQDAASPD